MNRKKRKTLDDTLASDFVYGESKSTNETPKVKQVETEPEVIAVEEESKNIAPIAEKKPTKELSLMDKLQVQSKEATKRFTVDLAESMHRKLSILAAKTGRSKADIVRMVLEDVLKDVEE